MMAIQHRLIAAAICAVFAMPALAFEAILDTNAEGGLRARLTEYSAVLTAQREGTTEPSDIVAAVQSDYRILLATLYRSGYYGPTIRIAVDGREGADMPLVNLPNAISNIVISVDTGAKFTFGNAQIGPLAPETLLPDGFAKGRTARSGEVGAAKDAAIDAWRAAAHPKAALSSQNIVADHSAKTLDVALGIAPGPRSKFGTLRFAGTDSVSSERLLEITGDIRNKSFSPETLDTVATRLRRTGAFQSVTITEAEALNDDDSLDVVATLTDAAPRRFGFGAELSSLEGGTLSTFWLHRNISGNADRLRFDGEISGLGSSTGVDYTLALSYRRPGTTRPVLALTADAKIDLIDDPNFRSSTGQFSVGGELTFSDTDFFSAGIGYRYSDVTDDFGNRNFSHFIIPIEGARDSRDNALNPTKGTYFAAEVMPFIGFNGSSDGLRLFADTRAYTGFGKDDQFVLAGRIMAGSILASAIDETPADLLFYSGGGGTVRGQPYQSLNVDLGGGVRAGGTSFLGFSTELRARVSKKVMAVGFADIGAVGENELPDNTMAWHSGAGLGLRYETGFGPIRLDVATPTSGTTGDGVQIYVGIGQAF